MTPALINKHFDSLIAKTKKARQVRKQIGMTSNACCYLRWRIKRYNDVRLQTKMNWLEKAGYDLGYTRAFTKAEMVSFAKYCQAKSQKKHLQMGFEFLLEQWMVREARKG